MNKFSRFALVGMLAAAAALMAGQTEAVVADDSAAGAVFQSAEEGAAVFSANCASCHQADGRGISGAFPPLRGNPKSADAVFVESVIRDGLSGPIEVLGESYDSAMPAVVLSDTELASVVAYVATLAGSGEPSTDTSAPVAAAPVGDQAVGYDLFVGGASFSNGGPACAACHAAGAIDGLGGPGLGPDLTAVFDRLGGEAGLTGWLVNPPSPTMAPLFINKALTEPEIAHLVAFLGETRVEPSPAGFDVLLLVGLGGAVVLLAGLAIASRTLRRPYVERIRSRA